MRKHDVATDTAKSTVKGHQKCTTQNCEKSLCNICYHTSDQFPFSRDLHGQERDFKKFFETIYFRKKSFSLFQKVSLQTRCFNCEKTVRSNAVTLNQENGDSENLMLYGIMKTWQSWVVYNWINFSSV